MAENTAGGQPHRGRDAESLPLGILAALFLLPLGHGCAELPRDQDGWTSRIRKSGDLPVGVSRDPGTPAALEGHEKRIVKEVARRLNARVVYRPGNTHALLRELEDRKLPAVAAPINCDSPFAAHVGMSQPYLKNGPERKDYCLAVAPGENRLLLLVDQVIAGERRDR